MSGPNAASSDYSFHIWRDIERTLIDETFTSSPEGFDSVLTTEDYQLPKP